jgi:hypothetical protein
MKYNQAPAGNPVLNIISVPQGLYKIYVFQSPLFSRKPQPPTDRGFFMCPLFGSTSGNEEFFLTQYILLRHRQNVPMRMM